MCAGASKGQSHQFLLELELQEVVNCQWESSARIPCTLKWLYLQLLFISFIYSDVSGTYAHTRTCGN